MKKEKMTKFQTIRKSRLFFVWTVLTPILCYYIIVRIVNIGGTILVGFFKWSLIGEKVFVGLRNYGELFRSELFWIAVRNTGVLAFLSLGISIGIALGLALILDRPKMKFANVYKAIYFVPFIISWVPLSVIWKWMYDPTYGILNYAISLIGMKPRGWLIDPNLALFSIMILIVWRSVGLNTLFLSVGLANIPHQYREAARIDSAGNFQLFRYIILPLLKPIVFYLIVMSTILNFSLFAPIYIMTVGSQGAPANAVRVLIYDIYENAFRFFHMGYAGAESTILLVIVLILTLFQTAVFRRKAY